MQSNSKYIKNISYNYADDTLYNSEGYKFKKRAKTKVKKFKQLKYTYEQ